MRELALFAGAGGGLLASKLLGWRTVCAVEFDEYRRCLLIQRQNERLLESFPIWDDIRTFDGRPWRGLVDVVSGGFPCQAFSTAAAGKNNADDLWPEMRRIVADVSPQYVFAENVTAAAIEWAAQDLGEMGYKTKAVELSAADLGADHIRTRFWLRAYTDKDGKFSRAFNAEVACLPEFRAGVWQAKPDELRVPDGMAYGLEPVKAAGDGQVPIVAATAWRLLGGE